MLVALCLCLGVGRCVGRWLGWLGGWLGGRCSAGRSGVGRAVGRSVRRPVGRLVGRSVGRAVARPSPGRSAGRQWTGRAAVGRSSSVGRPCRVHQYIVPEFGQIWSGVGKTLTVSGPLFVDIGQVRMNIGPHRATSLNFGPISATDTPARPTRHDFDQLSAECAQTGPNFDSAVAKSAPNRSGANA